jgi:aminobenzoyl-glutamate utilization protein B
VDSFVNNGRGVRLGSAATAKQSIVAWLESNAGQLSEDHQTIWKMAEPAWREHQAAAWFAQRLQNAGFQVERGSANMPTAFSAEWVSPAGVGPVIASYAEYDAVPGNSQAAVPFRQPLAGRHETAPAFIDPHSALGIGSLAGFLAAQAAIKAHGFKGTLRFFGEPAENMCAGKCRHAAQGYYDNLDAVLTWRPTASRALANTCMWDVHCGCFWSVVFTFRCCDPIDWQKPLTAATNSFNVRPPGALDALCLMYTTTKYTKEAMLPTTGGWSLSEAILSNASNTANNHAPRFAQIQYSWRCPTIDMAQRVLDVLQNNARHVAAMTHTQVQMDWVSKTRAGLPNHAIADLAFANLRAIGGPKWNGDAIVFANACRASLGLPSSTTPLDDRMSETIEPKLADAKLRADLPSWQQHYSADDYVEYTWHAPTARILVGRPCLKPQHDGEQFPSWANVALGGFAAAIDPTISTAAKAIGMTTIDLLTDSQKLAECQSEFERRTGGGIGGDQWQPPLLDQTSRPPIDFPWPEYRMTPSGQKWMIAASEE